LEAAGGLALRRRDLGQRLPARELLEELSVGQAQVARRCRQLEGTCKTTTEYAGLAGKSGPAGESEPGRSGEPRRRPEAKAERDPRRGAAALEALRELVGLGLGQPTGLDRGLELVDGCAVQRLGELLRRDVQSLRNVVQKRLARVGRGALGGRVGAARERCYRQRRQAEHELSLETALHLESSSAGRAPPSSADARVWHPASPV